MHHYSQGKHTKQAHKGIPENHFEEEQGRKGFFGPVSHLIRKKPSTRWKKISGPLQPALYDLVELKKSSNMKRLFYNQDIGIYYQWEDPKKWNEHQAIRNADGDVVYFCHKGKGSFFTEYGMLDYTPGSYVVIPKCITHTIAPNDSSVFLVIESLTGAYTEPARGMVGKNAVYDLEQIGKPELERQNQLLEKNKVDIKQIYVKHENETTLFEYSDTVYDVIGWKGDLFPFTLHMNDLMPLMSHRAHLPPSAHTTFVAPGFVICSFVPRPLETDEDALKVPFYHQNMDYDEILFYHAGNFFSRDGLHEGMITLHPAGFPHGPHPKAIEKVKTKTHTDEYAVMIDTWNHLKKDSVLSEIEVKEYWNSWNK